MGIDSAQVKEDEKVKILRKYLTGDARLKIGEYHKTLVSALDALQDYFGNPRAIWAKAKKNLQDAVGNYRKDWGVYGQQRRVMAIARTEEFIREAESLAADFGDVLENEVYSSSTTHLLKQILPQRYSEEVNDAIADVNMSEKDKLKAIKDFLVTKKKSAILGIDPELEQQQGYRGNGRRSDNSHHSSTED